MSSTHGRWWVQRRALVVVHIGGIVTPRIGELQEMCAKAGILLIEDAATRMKHLQRRRGELGRWWRSRSIRRRSRQAKAG
jgi:hypothetical protein